MLHESAQSCLHLPLNIQYLMIYARALKYTECISLLLLMQMQHLEELPCGFDNLAVANNDGMLCCEMIEFYCPAQQ